jgi:hypothetical protein
MRAPLADLPFWPRLLSRDEAARYVGTSTETFDREVISGIWPAPLRRGARHGRATWDRLALDRAADRASGLDQPAFDHGLAAREAAHESAKAQAMAAAKSYPIQSLRPRKR